MRFLLDANVLIDANRDHYPIERIPEFWDSLAYQGGQGNVKIPVEIYEEVKDGNDVLTTWIKQPSIKEAPLLEDESDVAPVSRAVAEGYAPDLTDDEVEKVAPDSSSRLRSLSRVGCCGVR